MSGTVTIAATDLVLPDYRLEHWQADPNWEQAHLESMRANVSEGMVVYDVGAELGDFTALFASWAGSVTTYREERDSRGHSRRVEIERSLVVPVEPSPWYWPAIRETFDLNGLAPPVGSFCGFASTGTAYTESPRRAWPRAAAGSYTQRQGFSNVRERPDLPRITLDDLARMTRPPDAISMDVEGAEHHVLCGAARVLREHRPMLWVSVHPDCLRRDWNVTDMDLHQLLGSFGYEATLLVHGHEDFWAYWIPGYHEWTG